MGDYFLCDGCGHCMGRADVDFITFKRTIKGIKCGAREGLGYSVMSCRICHDGQEPTDVCGSYEKRSA